MLRAHTDDEFARAFTEWERRHREEPDRFQSESERVAGSADDYGSSCAPYFRQILDEVAALPKPSTSTLPRPTIGPIAT